MHKGVHEVWRKAIELTALLLRWVETRDGETRFILLSKPDQLRLLVLETWSIRYRLPVLEILDIVVPFVRLRWKSRGRVVSLLRFRIAALAGNSAEVYLREQLAKRYPNGENYAAWRQREIEHQLLVEEAEELGDLHTRSSPIGLLGFDTGEAYVAAYRERVLKARAAYNKEASARWRKRKRYRGNPFL